jgi:hypothetical protein
MATNTVSESLEVSGPRKRKLSTKAITNGDVKRKKSATNKGVTVAPTPKKVTGVAVPSKPANRASGKVTGKNAQKATVEDVEDLDDSNDDQAADGSVDNPDDDDKTEEETNEEAAEESAETELGRKHIFRI